MKIGAALQEAFDAETRLACALLRTGRRHADEPEVFHLSRTLSAWCERHAERLAAQAERYGAALESAAAPPEEPADDDPGLVLLRDLRDLHLAAARASLAWTVLGQGAQAVHDTELLDAVAASHPETIRTLRWTVQKLKDASPQVLSS